MKLNLGCADSLLRGFTNVDVHVPAQIPPGIYFKQADLSLRWPWDDNTVAHVVAHDIIEHLPSKIHTMNELYRVLAPGGTAHIRVPTTDGRGAFQDPTHKTWWTPNDWRYYCEGHAEWERFRRSYGITCRFKLCRAETPTYLDHVTYSVVALEALK